MKSPRLTLLGLMAVIAVIALMLAALLHPSPLVASVAWTGTLTLLIVAALVAMLDPRRAFWVGFATAGLLFAGFAAFPYCENENPLFTTRILIFIFGYMKNGDLKFNDDSPNSIYLKDIIVTDDSYAVPRQFLAFHRIGESVAALIHAGLGGYLAVFLRSRLLRNLEPKTKP